MQSSSTATVAATPSIELNLENIEIFYTVINECAFDINSRFSASAQKILSLYLRYLNYVGTQDVSWQPKKRWLCSFLTHLAQSASQGRIGAGFIEKICEDIRSDGKLISVNFIHEGKFDRNELLAFISSLKDIQLSFQQSIAKQEAVHYHRSSEKPQFAELLYSQQQVLDDLLFTANYLVAQELYSEAISLYEKGEAIVRAITYGRRDGQQYYATTIQRRLAKAYLDLGIEFSYSNPAYAQLLLQQASEKSNDLANDQGNIWFQAENALSVIDYHIACLTLNHHTETACRYLRNAVDRLRNVSSKFPYISNYLTTLEVTSAIVIGTLYLKYNHKNTNVVAEKLILAGEIIYQIEQLTDEDSRRFYSHLYKQTREHVTLHLITLFTERTKNLTPAAKLGYLKDIIIENDKLYLASCSKLDSDYQQYFLKQLIHLLNQEHSEYDTEQLDYLAATLERMLNKIPVAFQDITCREHYSDLLKSFMNHIQAKMPTHELASTTDYLAIKNSQHDYSVIIKIFEMIPKEFNGAAENVAMVRKHQYLLIFTLKYALLDPHHSANHHIKDIKTMILQQNKYVIVPDSFSDLGFGDYQRMTANLLFEYAVTVNIFNVQIYFLHAAISAINKNYASMLTAEDYQLILKFKKMIQLIKVEALLRNTNPLVDKKRQIDSMDKVFKSVDEITNFNLKGFENCDLWFTNALAVKHEEAINYHSDRLDHLVDELAKKLLTTPNFFNQHSTDTSDLKIFFFEKIKPLKNNKSAENFEEAEDFIKAYLEGEPKTLSSLLNRILETIEILTHLELDNSYVKPAPTRRHSI